jgi:hypothetical protein
MGGLYDDDIVLWSEQQAELLRQRAAGQLVNDAEFDWPNIAEEIESVGNEPRFAVESLLVQAIVHRLKAEAWPSCRDVENWLADSMRFRGDAASRFVPSMCQRIDMDRIWRRAHRAMPRAVDGVTAPPPMANCPFTLDELLRDVS